MTQYFFTTSVINPGEFDAVTVFSGDGVHVRAGIVIASQGGDGIYSGGESRLRTTASSLGQVTPL